MVKAKRTPEQLQKLPIVGKQPENEKEDKFLRELCDYEFINTEEAGLTHKFGYGSSTNYHTFEFWHGAVYKVPRFIARHIESCVTPIWAWRPDGTGRMNKQYIGTKPRFQMRQKYNG